MSSFKFMFFGWLFASQKTGFSGLRYRFIPSLRFGTGFASPYNPCHGLKLKNSKLNQFKFKILFSKAHKPMQNSNKLQFHLYCNLALHQHNISKQANLQDEFVHIHHSNQHKVPPRAYPASLV